MSILNRSQAVSTEPTYGELIIRDRLVGRHLQYEVLRCAHTSVSVSADPKSPLTLWRRNFL